MGRSAAATRSAVPGATCEDVAAACIEALRAHGFKRTGRVGFNGAEYQLAKDGIGYMDQLAEIVDQRTAIEAADWSEHHLAGLRHGANPCTCATPSGPDYCPEHAA